MQNNEAMVTSASEDASEDLDGSPPTLTGHHPVKAYDNAKWMHTRSARHIRILCEHLEVQDRLQNSQILFSILVFGSARSFPRDKWEIEYSKCNQEVKWATEEGNEAKLAEATRRLRRICRIEKLCEYYDKTYQLSKLLMQWIQTREARQALARILREVPSPSGAPCSKYFNVDLEMLEDNSISQVALCTGGGKGLMEAANKGAYEVDGARSMGMGVSLPFEPEINRFVDPDLAFEFHYFFTRKFWMAYSALALIAVPGGLGTLDELMELLTLKQTGKLKRDIPVVLFGEKFWKEVINFDALVDYGTISERDREQLFFTDDPIEAFNYIKDHILADKLILGDKHVHKSIKHHRGSKTMYIDPF